MKLALTIAFAAALVAIAATSSPAQQMPGSGFTQIICVLGVHGSGTYGKGQGNLVVTVVDHGIIDPVNHIGAATVTIEHGATGGSREVAYRDNNHDGVVDCGDDILTGA